MAGGVKIKKFFKTKGKQYGKDLLASYRGDANGKLFGGDPRGIIEKGMGIGRSGKNRYNLKIADGLQDLLHGTLGIRTSHVQNIEKNVRGMIEKDRAERIKKSIVSPKRSSQTPAGSRILTHPHTESRDDGSPIDPHFTKEGDSVSFPNEIHFRSLIRRDIEVIKNENTIGALKSAGDNWFDESMDKLQGWIGETAADQWTHKSRLSREVVYDIFLYLPKQLSDSVKVTYASEGVGMGEAFFANLFSGFDANEQAAVKGVTGDQKADVDEWLKFIRGMLPGGKIIQMATGSMINPMKFQSLEGVDFRTYTYKFTLRPKDQYEAADIRDIIYAFKYSMLPGTAGYNSKLWTFPNEWAIRFQGPIKNWIDFPLSCVCTGCDVDYGGGANVTTFVDGAPTAIDLTLTFTETVQLSRERYQTEVAPRPMDPLEMSGVAGKRKYLVRDETVADKGIDFTAYADIKPSERNTE